MNVPYLVFGGAELPWIYGLAVELARVRTTALVGLRAELPWRRAPASWPFDDAPDELHRQLWRYPPGFNRRLAAMYAGLIRARVGRLSRALRERAGAAPYVLISDPRLYPYLRDVTPDRLVYLLYDDYSVSERSVRRRLPAEEHLLRHAGTLLCSSAYHADMLRRELPVRRDAVFHFPHGVHDSFLHPDATTVPLERRVCIVGAMTSRYDWPLIETVISRLADIAFVFAGEIDTKPVSPAETGWRDAMQRVLQLPNVRHVRGLRHRETAAVYWSSSLSWLPYRADSAFVRASCPLKLTDGLASARPVVSADVPESRLYPQWVSVYSTAEEAAALIARLTAEAGSAAAVAQRRAQLRYAAANTWSARATALLRVVERSADTVRDLPVHFP